MREIQLEIREYLQKNMGIYILILILFSAGVLAGAFLVRGLGDSQDEALQQYFDLFINSCLESQVPEGRAILGQSVKINFQHLLLIWISGLFIFGFPVAAI
ncbi:MAG TPA: hypothetical protein GX693_05465, partial [Firmicutes bacterium]|nr:hypothetical protein [Bacillota bacterium]